MDDKSIIEKGKRFFMAVLYYGAPPNYSGYMDYTFNSDSYPNIGKLIEFGKNRIADKIGCNKNSVSVAITNIIELNEEDYNNLTK